MRELDPDVLTGWNVIDFDLAGAPPHRLAARASRWRSAAARARCACGGRPRGVRQAGVPGRVVLDGIQLLRGAFIRMEDYASTRSRAPCWARASIDSGRRPGGGGPAPLPRGPPRFVDYNRTDARLALEILERLRLVELAVERSLLTGMPLDRVGSSIAAFDFRYLAELAGAAWWRPASARRRRRSRSPAAT